MLKELRFIAGFPFGLLAECFARLAILISDNQLNVDFNYIGRRKCMTFKYSSRMCEFGTKAAKCGTLKTPNAGVTERGAVTREETKAD